MVRIQERRGGHDHSGSAVGALHRAFFQKSLLQRMQVLAAGQALDRGHFAIADDSDLRAAGALRGSVDQDGACAALSFAAAVLCSSEIELVAQDAEQSPLRVGVNLKNLAVYFYLRDFRHESSRESECL